MWTANSARGRGSAFCSRMRRIRPKSPFIQVLISRKTSNDFHLKNKKRNNAMTSAAMSPITGPTPQIEPANFLNLLIIDDERTIREACREIAQSLGFTAHVADSA